MEQRFYKAIFPAEARVCGRWLKPLTLWQELILEGIGSPFATGEGSITADDVLAFCRVAECSYPELPDWRPRVLDAFRPGSDWRWRRRMARNREVLVREAGRIASWLRDVNSAPEFWQTPGECPGRITGPPIWAMAWKLVMGCRYTIEEAMNETAGRAWWATAQVDELRGEGKRFAWMSDLEDQAPDLREVPEEELVEMARRDMPPDRFHKWHQARKASLS